MKKLISLLIIGVLIGCAGVSLAEDAAPILPPGDITEKGDIIKDGTITLREGWNLIAIPVIPAEPLTVEKFIQKVTGLTDDSEKPQMAPTWEVPVVAVYKNGRFEIYPRKGVTYNMVPGEAYFVYAQYVGPRPVYDVDPAYPMKPFCPTVKICIQGKPVDASVSLHLSRGWNGVSVMRKSGHLRHDFPILNEPPILPSATNNTETGEGDAQIDRGILIFRLGTSLSVLSRELNEQGIKATRIIFWNSSTQQWEQYTLPFTPAPPTVEPYPRMIVERLISASEGFFLLCQENGLYVPGLGSRPDVPPWPPIQPTDVRFTGIIREKPMQTSPLPAWFPVFKYWLGNLAVEAANNDIDQALAEAMQEGTEHTLWGTIRYIKDPNNTGEQGSVLTVTSIAPKFVPGCIDKPE